MSLRILRLPEIRSLLSFGEAIAAVEKAFAAYAAGEVILPGVVNLDIDEFRGEVHIKSAYIRGQDHYVIKIASGFYNNPEQGLPVGNGLMLVFNAKTGALESLLLDRGYVTDLRTGAAGAVAAKYLAKERIRKAAFIGAGTQARFQLRALAEVRNSEEVWVWSIPEEHIRSYIAEMSPAFPAIKFHAAATAEEAVRGADLLVTVTPSRKPLVKPEWIAAGCHITAVGSDGPEKQELETGVLARADLIVCDSIAQCRRLGEVHHGLEDKSITEDRVHTELGEIALGHKPGRTDDLQVTVADLTGLGAQDAAAASLICTKALAAGLGSHLEV